MTERSTARPLVCVLLVLSLCAPMIAIAAPAPNRDRALEVECSARCLTVVLITRSGGGYDHARLRSCAPALFTVPRSDTGASDPEHVSTAIQGRVPRSLWMAGLRTGRSPPIS